MRNAESYCACEWYIRIALVLKFEYSLLMQHNNSNKQDGTVLIEYSAVPNQRLDHDGEPLGWLPAVWESGRRIGDTYAARGLSREDALMAAKHEAEERARHYIGDWTVTVQCADPS